MKLKRAAVTFLAISMVAGTLTGCGSGKENDKADAGHNVADTDTDTGSDGEQTTIRFAWWGSQDRADRTNEAVEIFMEKNPDIKVETSFYPFDSYYENLSISATSNNMPDVFQGFIGAIDCTQYISQGLVEPLDEYIEQGLIDTSNIPQNLLDTGMNEGKNYGLSLGSNVKCMVVDPDAYKKAGLEIPEVAYESWDALEADLVKLKEVTGAYGADDMFGLDFMMEYYCRQNGEEYMSSTEESTIGCSEETYTSFYERRLDWIDKGLIPPYDVSQAQNGLEDSQIVKGKSAVRSCYSTEYGTLAGAAQKELKMILLPGPDTDKGTDIRAGQHVCMSSQSKNKEAAAKLIDFLINDVDGNKVLNAERGMPASDTVRDALKENFDDNQKKMAEIVDLAVEHSSAPLAPVKGDTADMFTLLNDLDQEILYKSTTPQDAYQQLVDASGK